MTQAKTLNCPMCGAPAASDATSCEHCGARLATVACPSCFGMIFQGAKFCSHCGAAVNRTELPAEKSELCPRCRINMQAVLIGQTHLRECSRCEGIWVDAASLQKICADREEQSAVLGMPGTVATPETVNLEKNIRYVPCPVCSKLMNRVNFGNCSHVVVDVCREHGTWFDRDELRRIVEFIRAGGLEKAREREMGELEERRQRLNAAQLTNARADANLAPRYGHGDWDLGISAAVSSLSSLFD